MGTEDQRNSAHRGPVEQRNQRNRHRVKTGLGHWTNGKIVISLMYFKDLARFVFYCDELHRGSLCFLKIVSCKRAELRYISMFEFFPCRMHKCRKKFPHNFRQADCFARS